MPRFGWAFACVSFSLALTLATIDATACGGASPDIQSTASLEFPFIPNESETHGSLCTKSDPDFSQLRYSERIPVCQRKVSQATKREIYRQYGVRTGCESAYTIDHLIPLSLGGTNHGDNLWPEAKSIKALRQQLEQDLYKKISQGLITQDQAIRTILQAKFNPPVKNPGEFEFCY